MSEEDGLEPRLGRPGDRRAESPGRFAGQVRKAAARLGPAGKGQRPARARHVRGAGAAALHALRRGQRDVSRMRRAVVKVYIARAGRAGGARAFARHVSYVERDGVDRDGGQGRAYDRDGDGADTAGFRQRSADDPRQFRLIVSAEDGDRLEDLRPGIRRFMAGVEADLGTRLDWIAVDHRDTAQPHTHVVIRGRDGHGQPLVIDRDYLMRGLRHRLEDQLTERLGPRREMEILRQRSREVSADRVTAIDRAMGQACEDGVLTLTRATSERGRFERSLMLRRLGHLRSLGLAENRGQRWTLSPGWQETLARLGRRGDIVRAIAARHGDLDLVNQLCVHPAGAPLGAPVTGRVIGSVATDELRDGRSVLIAATDGRSWSVDLGAAGGTDMPPPGAVVTLRQRGPEVRSADRTIARIASLNAGLWSDAAHAACDPGAGPAFRDAHRRRLEALSRAGLVQRLDEGGFAIGPEFLKRVQEWEAGRGARLEVRIESPRGLEGLARARALTWLDRVDAGALAATGFGGEVQRARARRLDWLREEGLLGHGQTTLTQGARDRLTHMEIGDLAGMEARASARGFVTLNDGEAFEGRFERWIEAHQGRLALVGNESQFTLVPARTGMGSGLGREITLTRRGQSLDWTIGRTRGHAL